MNIFDNLIKETEIIGIGALNSTESQSGARVGTLLANTTIEYSFRVFTKSSSIVIYSPAFGKDQLENANAWLKRYLEIRDRIASDIGELQSNS